MNKLPKLIFSDLDGTLVPEGESTLPLSLVAVLDELAELGIPLIVSSGRQADSLRRVFSVLRTPPLILALNGGALLRGEELLFQDPLPQQEALAIAREAAEIEDVHVILETARECWVYGLTNPLVPLLEEREYHVKPVDDLNKVEGEVIKVACYSQGNLKQMLHWADHRASNQVKAARSGQYWVDFNVADKGKGLLAACKLLRVAPEDTAAFGDNLNDASMLAQAGQGFAVAGSVLAHTGDWPICQTVEAELKKFLEMAKKHLHSR